MKFKIESTRVKSERNKKWHTWFAWYPARINENEIVWLESVRRKGILVDRPPEHPYWKWFYKPQGVE